MIDIYAVCTETSDGLKVRKTTAAKWEKMVWTNRKAYDLGQITLYLSRPKYLPESDALRASMEFFQEERRKLLGYRGV